jgi:hypothetical protein
MRSGVERLARLVGEQEDAQRSAGCPERHQQPAPGAEAREQRAFLTGHGECGGALGGGGACQQRRRAERAARRVHGDADRGGQLELPVSGFEVERRRLPGHHVDQDVEHVLESGRKVGFAPEHLRETAYRG